MDSSKKLRTIGFIILAFVSLCIAAYLEIFLEVACYARSGVLSGFTAAHPQATQFLRLATLWIITAAASWMFWKFHSPVLRIIYRYRYSIVMAVLLVCILLEISGSSIACLGKQIGSKDMGTLFGIPRMIRSDEYATFTPLTFSQYYNYSGQYPYFSETIRGTLTDTYVVCGLPSWDIAMIFRPFLWGFLFLDPAKGLSFLWVARPLALFMVSFELAKVYSKDDKWLSLAAAALITLSPIVQWWTAYEILICGQGALLCVYGFMRTEKTVKRVIAALLFNWLAGVYIMTLYPAWQVPMLYVFAALFIYVIIDCRKGFKFCLKTDIPAMAAGLILLSVGLIYIITKSGDTITTVMDTVYPGQRVETGGQGFAQLFRYGATLFFPLTARGLNTNVCEASVFFDLFPMGILLSLYIICFEKKKDRMLILLLAVQGIFLCYCIFGFPEFMANITLLKYSPTNRILFAEGFTNILLLIRSMSVFERKPKTALIVILSLGMSVGVSLLCRRATGDYIGVLFGAAVVALLFTGFMLTLMARSAGWRKLFALFCTLVVLISGGLVNPVQRGVDVIYQNDLVQSIQSVAEKDNGLWIVEGDYPLTNVPILVGAPTINSTNVYPDMARWHLLDPDGKYEQVYNRYAHIAVDLTAEETRFDLIQADKFLLTLNYGDLKTLGVEYVLTADHYDGALCSSQVEFELIDEAEGLYIYKIMM